MFKTDDPSDFPQSLKPSLRCNYYNQGLYFIAVLIRLCQKEIFTCKTAMYTRTPLNKGTPNLPCNL